MPNQLDYYVTLQINRNASQDDIQRAWERLSKQYDPATSRKPRAAQRYAEIQEAYETLGDRDRRREYDRTLRRDDRAVAGALVPSEVLSNRFILVAAGTLIASIIAVVAVILLFGGGDDDPAVIATGTPTATPTAAPTPPAQTPGVPAESPPDVTGEEVVLDSGLTYIDITVGTGEEARTGDLVAVNYTGWLQDTGTRFDSSIDSPTAFTLTLGAGGVIDGWEQGIPGMREGGERRLIIPPELGYGSVGSGDVIPPNATLIFDIVLIDILSPAPSPTPAATATPALPPTQEPTTPPESPPEVEGEETTLPSGLVIIDIEEGEGEEVGDGDVIAVNYTGWLQETGAMFDSSLDNTSPYQLAIGQGGVIAGWEQGVPGMKPGGVRRLIIPPELAYGDAGQGDIPGGATLIFDIELVAVLLEGGAAAPSETAAP